MAGKLTTWQTQDFRGWASKITKANHLGSILQLSPQQAAPTMIQLMSVDHQKDLNIFLEQFPTKTFDNDNDYTWELIGSARRNITLKEARWFNGSTYTKVNLGDVVGQNGETFELVFPEAWFFNGELLYGNLNELYPMRVLGDPRMEGTDAVYTVELINGSNLGIPGERLQRGEKFSYSFAPVSRGLSRDVGGTRHATPASMRNEFTQIRIKDKMSGDMMDAKVAMSVPLVNSEGKLVNQTAWMFLAEWELEKTWSEYKSNALAYAVSNRNANGEYNNFDQSGEVIRMGDGIYAQCAVANNYYYNKFSLKLIEDILYRLSTDVIGNSNRTFILKTGKEGALLFHKAITDVASGWTANNISIDAQSVGAVQKTTSSLHPNALKIGYMYTEWVSPFGFTVKVDVDNTYDDKVRNKVMIGDKPAQSRRFDIWDIGDDKQTNICKCAVSNRPDLTAYSWGLRNPWTGQYGNPYSSHDEDSATIRKMGTLGAIVYDPTRTVSLIPDVLSD